MNNINNSSMSANKNINLPDIKTKKANTNSDNPPEFKPAAVWESPSFEEFTLCMEVTTYVHQWE
ncbi:MAG: pyrroloquinoline quinone precursor peptide PqqA [Cyanobacteria bacterium P01_A01_bin.84]